MIARAGLFLLLLAGCGGGGDTITLQGSGATFPAPLYQRWFRALYDADPTRRVNYQGVGSSAGVRQFSDGLTVLGATDAPLKDDEIAATADRLKVGVLQVPMTAGAVSVCYNVPGVPPGTPLKISRDVLFKFLLQEEFDDEGKARKITHWDDVLLRRLNPGVSLPSLPITWVRRSEGSGTTYAFTTHLAAAGKDRWVKAMGKANKSVTWKVGIGARGNDGVAALIEQTPGALGYVEFGYAELSRLPSAALENRSGRFVAPSKGSNTAALAGVKVPADFRIAVPDPAGPDAYPIVTYTWMIARKEYRDPRVAAAVRDAMTYCAGEGQGLSDQLGYIPLPAEVAERVKQAIAAIEPKPKH